MPTFSQAGRALSIHVTNLQSDALLLETVSGAEAISQPFEYQLELLAPHAVEFGKVLGATAMVTVGGSDGPQRTIHGIIASFSEGARLHGIPLVRCRAKLVPALWLLSQRVQNRVFQHKSVKDILQQVLVTEWQLDVAMQLSKTYHPRNYCVQYGESDLAFLSRLMEDEGIAYFFEFSATGHKLHVVDNPAFFAELPAPHSLIFDSSIQPAVGPRIDDWEKTQELRPLKYVHRDYCFELPDQDLTAETEAGTDARVNVGTVTHALARQHVVRGVAMLEHYEYPAGVTQRYDGIDRFGNNSAGDLAHIRDDQARLAQVRLEAQLSQSLAIRGVSNICHLTAGHRFQLERHPDSATPPGGGDIFLFTRVEMSASIKGSYGSGQPEPFVYENRFTCMPGGLVYRPAQSTPRPRVLGQETALVVGPGSEEIHCDRYGRVKVQFRWDRAPEAGDSSCWLRVSQPWAGQSWGALTLPRVGQEVVVGFEGGDPDRPLILGSLYNAAQMPPYQLPEQRRQSGLVSSSGKGADQYHELRFDDTEGSELLHVHSEKDMNLHAENDHDHHVGHDHLQRIGNDHHQTVVKDQHIAVGGSVHFTVGQGVPGDGSGSGGGTSESDVAKKGQTWGDKDTPVGTWSITVANWMTMVYGIDNKFVLGLSTTTVAGGMVNVVFPTRFELRMGYQWNCNLGFKSTVDLAKEIWTNTGQRTLVSLNDNLVKLLRNSVNIENNAMTAIRQAHTGLSSRLADVEVKGGQVETAVRDIAAHQTAVHTALTNMRTECIRIAREADIDASLIYGFCEVAAALQDFHGQRYDI